MATTDIHDHPSYREIDDVFASSSNVVDFAADTFAVGRCGAVDDDGCIRFMASGSGLVQSGLVQPGAAAIHLDRDTALRLLVELAETLGVIVLEKPTAHTIPTAGYPLMDLIVEVVCGQRVEIRPANPDVEEPSIVLDYEPARILAAHAALAATEAETDGTGVL